MNSTSLTYSNETNTMCCEAPCNGNCDRRKKWGLCFMFHYETKPDVWLKFGFNKAKSEYLS